MIRRLRPFALLLVLPLALALVACGGSSDKDESEKDEPKTTATATPQPGPDGWDTFDDSGYSGYIDGAWDYAVLTRDEFVELADEGISQSRLSDIESFRNTDPKDLAETVLLVMMAEDFPNVNVQRCVPDARSKNITPMIDFYQKSGIDVDEAGEVTYEGERSAVLRASLFDGIDTFQTIVGNSKCYSIVTLTAREGDTAAFDDWQTFMEHLHVAPLK